MNSSPIILTPGRYQYSYPTFTDVPQFIDIHFLTPDGQQAFVSYPQHPHCRAPQLVPIGWFSAIIMCKVEGQLKLMDVIELLLTGWSREQRSALNSIPKTYDYSYMPAPADGRSTCITKLANTAAV